MSPAHLCAMKAPCGQTTRDRGPPVGDLWPGRIELPGKARSVKTEEAGTQKPASSSPSPREPAGGGAPRTQLGDAPHAGGQEGLLQGPELQLRVGIGALILAQGPAVVGAEVRRQREDTCGRQDRRSPRGSKEKLSAEQGQWQRSRLPLGTADSHCGQRCRARARSGRLAGGTEPRGDGELRKEWLRRVVGHTRTHSLLHFCSH